MNSFYGNADRFWKASEGPQRAPEVMTGAEEWFPWIGKVLAVLGGAENVLAGHLRWTARSEAM